MRIAMLSPIAWRTPPRHYGPWEQVVSLLTEGLVARGVDVTLFATADSRTAARLHAVCPTGWEEDPDRNPKVWECLHISEVFEHAGEFDLIHNHFDFLPLTYSRLVETPLLTTIHGFSSPKILPVYRKYDATTHYVAISEADRAPELHYVATIHHGIDLTGFTFRPEPGEYLLFFGRIHHDKGTHEAIQIAREAGMKLILAGVVQDQDYFRHQVAPYLDDDQVVYVGSADPAQRDRLLGGSLALLHPINFKEPFGLSVIEAMACGTPVVAFNRGSMPELVVPGQTGFLVDSVDEAVEAVRRVADLDRSACRRHVEAHFTVDRMVERYLQAYRTVLDRERREDHRPWGWYRVLEDEPSHKTKRIVVYPGQRLSLQRHRRRSEHWHVVSGEAVVTRDQEQLALRAGDSVDIPAGAAHRIANPGAVPLTFIEVQQGDYFGEDDIERLEDDYGRS